MLGPPGTGKTTFLRNQVSRWSDDYGYAPEDFVLTSLTRTAANNLKGRVAVPLENCATLHALCYRGMGKPPIAEVGKLRKEWNEYVLAKGMDIWTLEKEGSVDEDIFHERLREHGAGQMLSAYTLWRVTGRRNPVLEEMTKLFAKYWEGFKTAHGAVDFTDMLEAGLSLDCCPGTPPVLMLDEAQDLTPLQWQVFMHWAAAAERVVIAGDPAQAIFGWAGATPDNLLTPIPAEQLRVLGQSHRLPPAIHAYAETWLGQHTPPMMEGRVYKPMETTGEVNRSEYSWEQADGLIEEIALRARLGMDVMVLATCGYMLVPLLDQLRAAGIPFHNPFRPTNGAWNPGSPEAYDAAINLLTDSADWWSWAQHLPARHFVGFKKDAFQKAPETVLSGEVYQRVYRGHDWRWYLKECIGNVHALEYELTCIGNQWAEKRVIVGTVHSVKGGEAECVYLFPDLSQAGVDDLETKDGRDAMIRLAYVGMTRSRSELMLCAPANAARTIDWL